MNIKGLKEIIKDLPDDMEVIIQKDSEGNGYSPLSEADSNAVYLPDNTWCGTVYSLKWNADDACVSEEDWKEIVATNKVLVLCPVN